MTPHYFVFDSERKLRYCGRMDDNNREEYVTIRDLRNALDDVLAGKEVEVKTTPTNGCFGQRNGRPRKIPSRHTWTKLCEGTG